MSMVVRFGKNYENLDNILEPYVLAMQDYDARIEIKGKRLEEANREQASWVAYYDERKVELNTYLKAMEIEVKRVRSQLYRKYNENYSRALGERQIEKYIDGNEKYIKAHDIYLAVKELHDKYDSIVNSFIQRGYALKNITQIRVSSLQDVTI
jgi:hypothetical protein